MISIRTFFWGIKMKFKGLERSAHSSKLLHLLQIATVVGIFVATEFLLGARLPRAAIITHGDTRYLTHVSTDKPIYRSGEKLYVRGVILRADSHSPKAGPQAVTAANF